MPKHEWIHNLRQKIVFKRANPKTDGSQAHRRYETYKTMMTVGTALAAGAARGDLKYDWARGFMTLRAARTSKQKRVKRVKDSAQAGKQATHHTLHRQQSPPRRFSSSSPTKSFNCIIPLGTRCVVANTLISRSMRVYSLPFDFCYTCSEMLVDCLRTDFKQLLDVKQLVEAEVDNGGVGHKLYSSMLSRRVVFPHHDPLNNKSHRQSYKRKIQRFRKVAALPGRKLMVLAEVCSSQATLTKARDAFNGGGEIIQLFNALSRVCNVFDLQVIIVVTGKASRNQGQQAPRVRPVFKHQQGRANLIVHELHCVGDCTGAYLRSSKDEDKFCRLIMNGRTFQLAPDPLQEDSFEQAERKRRSVTVDRIFKTPKYSLTCSPTSAIERFNAAIA